MQQTTQQIRGLVLINGTKSPDEWNRMSFDEKAAWLASLSPIAVRGQASVTAVTTRQAVEAVISGWAYRGYISHARALEALAAEANAATGTKAAA